MEIQIGDQFFGYTIQEQIGKGSYGTVYRVVKESEVGRSERALKVIQFPTKAQFEEAFSQNGQDQQATMAYFQSELKNILKEVQVFEYLSGSDGRHIVRYYANQVLEDKENNQYNVLVLMEYARPLGSYLATETMTFNQVIKLGFDVLQALQLCHNDGIIHRDVKIDNIFIGKEGDFKLGDFGVAKVLDDGGMSVSRKGTPNYIPPDVYLYQAPVDFSMDLYALAMVLYRVCNYMRVPFSPLYPQPVTAQQREEATNFRLQGKRVPALPQLPPAFNHVLIKALGNKGERYDNVQEFMNDWNTAARTLSPQQLNCRIGQMTFQQPPENSGNDWGAKAFSSEDTYVETPYQKGAPNIYAEGQKNINTGSGNNTNENHPVKKSKVSTGALVAIVAAVVLVLAGGTFVGAKLLMNNDSGTQVVSESAGSTQNGTTDTKEGSVTNETGTQADDSTQAEMEASAETEVETDSVAQNMVLPSVGADYPDYDQGLDTSNYLRVEDPDKAYTFIYPKDFFKEGIYDAQDKAFKLTTGDEWTSLTITEEEARIKNSPVDCANTMMYEYLARMVSSPEPYTKPSKTTTDDGYAIGIAAGLLASDDSKGQYTLIACNNTKMYILTFRYYASDNGESASGIDYTPAGYMLDCVYRGFSLSGTSYKLRSYNDYLKDNMGTKK